MVDAVNAINGAINSTIQKNKDLSIDWRNIKAEEVLEYAGQGQDVPIDILKWAEDYAKLEDAPEDVTYDSVGGATTLKEANENTETTEEIENPDKTEETEKEEKEEQIEGTGGTETTESTGEEDTVEAEDEPSLYEQAGILIPISENGRTSADMINSDTSSKADVSERTATQATQAADQTENRIRSTKSEYEELVQRLQSDKSSITPGDLLKLDKLAGRLQQAGTRAQSELASYDIQLQEIEDLFSQYSNITPEITNTGTESVTVGNQLVSENPPDWPFIFSREYTRGMQAIDVGSKAISSASQADGTIEDSNAVNKEAQATNKDAQDRIEELTYVENYNIDINPDKKDSEKKEQDNERNNNSALNKIFLNGVKDTTIQADDLEIKRRKANRGENPY